MEPPTMTKTTTVTLTNVNTLVKMAEERTPNARRTVHPAHPKLSETKFRIIGIVSYRNLLSLYTCQCQSHDNAEEIDIRG